MNYFRNKLISASVATAGVKVEGNEGATSRIRGLRLCPVLAPLEDWQLPQIPPQNLHPVPKTCQFRANPSPASQMLHLHKGFWDTPLWSTRRGRGWAWGGFGFIPGDFSKASGSQHLAAPGRRAKRDFFFELRRG